MRSRPETLIWGLLVLLGAGWLLLAGCGSESPLGPSGKGEGKQPAASQEPAAGAVKTPPRQERAGSGEALAPALQVLIPPEPTQPVLIPPEPGQVGLTEAELRAGPPPLDPETFEVAPPRKPGERGLTQAELEKLLRSTGPPPASIELEPEARN